MRHAVADSPEHRIIRAEILRVGAKSKRHEYIGCDAYFGKLELGWHDADHSPGAIANEDGSSDDAVVAREAQTPAGIREHGDRRVVRHVLVGRESPADTGGRANDAKEILRDLEHRGRS